MFLCATFANIKTMIMKRIAIVLAAMTLTGAAANAQNLLRSLGEKAKNAVENKAGQAIDRALGGKSSSSESSASGSDESEFNDAVYLSVTPDSDFDLEDVKPEVFANFAEAVKARPALPKAEKLVSHEDRLAFARRVAAYQAGVEALCQDYVNRYQALLYSSYGASQKSSAPANAQQLSQNISAAEIMAAFAAAGINPETATEEQMNEVIVDLVAKKNNLSKDEVRRMMASQEVSEPEKPSRVQEIVEALEALTEKKMNAMASQASNLTAGLQSALFGGKVSEANMSMDMVLAKLSDDIEEGWPKSAECREAGKAKDPTAAIDRYNRQSFTKWLAKLAKYESRDAEDAQQLAALDAELDAMPAAEKNSDEWKYAKSKAGMLNGIVLSYASLPSSVLDCPVVAYPGPEIEE